MHGTGKDSRKQRNNLSEVTKLRKKLFRPVCFSDYNILELRCWTFIKINILLFL